MRREVGDPSRRAVRTNPSLRLAVEVCQRAAGLMPNGLTFATFTRAHGE